MGRRFLLNIVTALAVVGLGVATIQAAAPQDDPLPCQGRARKRRDQEKEAAPADVLPEPTGVDEAPSNLGPRPPGYRNDETPAGTESPTDPPAKALPPVVALPAPAEVEPPPASFPAVPPAGTLDPAVEPAQTPARPVAPPPKPAAKPPTTTIPRVAQAQAPAPTPVVTPMTPALPPGEALPAAAEPPGQPAGAVPAATPAAENPEDDKRAFILPPERLPLGRQSLGLTVDMVAPQVLNLNQTAHLKVIVRNTGQTDALGVVVRDELPDTLKFVSSQPEAREIGGLYSWPIGTMPAGTEKVITLTVKPIKVGSFDHAATVTMLAGGKSRTLVREPRLKVEQSVVTSKVLRGQPVQFKIIVSNPGNGPARNVLVQAKLSPGLKHESGEPNDQNLFEQTIDLINPGERINLDTLVADSLQRGEQSCLIVAHSPDVVDGAPEARSLQTVLVVEPEIEVTLKGPDKRFTDMLAPYELTIKNKGTAPAKNVRVSVSLPISGRLYQIPPGAKFDTQTRKLSWTRAQIDADEAVVLPFQVRIGILTGEYKVNAEARADGSVSGQDNCRTMVEGLADVNCVVTEKRRVVDINGETVYTIKIDNAGTKEATRIQVTANLSEHIVATETSQGLDRREAQYNKETHEVVFPEIERLPAGKTIELGIKVKAVKDGVASCRGFLSHHEMKDRIDAVARFTVPPFAASPTRR